MNSTINTIIKFESKLHQIINMDDIQKLAESEFKKNKPKYHEEIQNLAGELMAAVTNYFEFIRKSSVGSLNSAQQEFIEHQICYFMPNLLKRVEECNLYLILQSQRLATMKPSNKFAQELNYIKQSFKKIIKTIGTQLEQTKRLFEVEIQDQNNENLSGKELREKELFEKHFFYHMQNEEDLAKILKKNKIDYQEAYNRRSIQIFTDPEQQILFEAVQTQKKEVITHVVNAYGKGFFLDGSRNNENKHPLTWATEVEKRNQVVAEEQRQSKKTVRTQRTKANSFSIAADSGKTMTSNFFKTLQSQNSIKKEEPDPVDKFAKLRLIEPTHDNLIREKSIEGNFVKDFTITSLSLGEGALLNNTKILILNLKILVEQEKLQVEDLVAVLKNAIQHGNHALFDEVFRHYLSYLTEVSFDFVKHKEKIKIDFACWAAFCGQAEMLKTILDKKLFVEVNLSSQLLLYIAAGGSISCFNFCLAHFKQMSEVVWQQATLIALAKGHYALYSLMLLELERKGINISNCFFENKEVQSSFNLCRFMNKLFALYQSGCVELLRQEQIDLEYLITQVPSAQRNSFFSELLFTAASTHNAEMITHALTLVFQELKQAPELFTLLASQVVLSNEMLMKVIAKKIMALPEQQQQFIEKQSLRGLYKFKQALIELYFDNLLTTDKQVRSAIVLLLQSIQKKMQEKGFVADIFDKQDKIITYNLLLHFYNQNFRGKSSSNEQAHLLPKLGKWSSNNCSSSESEHDSDHEQDNEPEVIQRNMLIFDEQERPETTSVAITQPQN